MCVNRSENHVRNVVSENKATAGTYGFGSNSSNFRSEENFLPYQEIKDPNCYFGSGVGFSLCLAIVYKAVPKSLVIATFIG